MMFEFYNHWVDRNKDFQLLSIYFHSLGHLYNELVIVIFNFQVDITFKRKK